MKLTKQRLKEIIKEEIENLDLFKSSIGSFENSIDSYYEEFVEHLEINTSGNDYKKAKKELDKHFKLINKGLSGLSRIK